MPTLERTFDHAAALVHINRIMACFAGICAVGKASDLRRQSVWQLGGDWVG